MNWNYIGIDDDPPAGKIQVLTSNGQSLLSSRTHPLIIAWSPIPAPDETKRQCQVILRGLPELRMVSCICKQPQLLQELETALAHYHDDQLADFTDLIRTLDRQAHNGVPCIPNFHK